MGNYVKGSGLVMSLGGSDLDLCQEAVTCTGQSSAANAFTPSLAAAHCKGQVYKWLWGLEMPQPQMVDL